MSSAESTSRGAHERSALDGLPQLADVAGPGQALEHAQRLARDRGRGDGRSAGRVGGEVPDEERDVPHALAERRQLGS